MELYERIVFLIIGGFVGFVLGYIVRSLRTIEEKVAEVDKHVMQEEDEHNRDERGEARMPSFQNIMLMIVVILVAYAAFVSQKASNGIEDNVQADMVNRCQSGEENREVQRATVDAIYNLATGVATPTSEDGSPLTDREILEYNRYIDQVNQFRTVMYKKIQPSEECLPYVKDIDVKPPTDPFPRIDIRPRGGSS